MARLRTILFLTIISTPLMAQDFEDSIRLYEKDFYAIEERRQGSEIIEVTVSPEGWPSYSLMDSEGDGGFQRRLFHGYPSIVIPNWVLFRF